MDVSSVLNAALVRAFLVSVLVGLSTGLAALQSGVDDRQALLAGLSAFVTGFLLRGFAEGGYDARRAATGDIKASDVGAKQVITKVTKSGGS